MAEFRQYGCMNRSPLFWTAIVLGVLLIALSLYAVYTYISLTTSLKSTNESLATAEGHISALEGTLASREEDNRALSEALENEKNKNQVFENQIKEISSTVGYLAKLQATDPELLKKYSRVYFLNENYAPKKLALIDPAYLFTPSSYLEIHTDVQPFLERMLRDAREDGLALSVISAFRSFGTQASLKSSYVVSYGSGANRFSADQGYSEHQLGTTVDFTTVSVGSTFTGFEKSPEYAWLLENAYKYGFVLSYPKNNQYYQFEPWHWRFVGVELARELHKENKFFYDMDQREIDTYLGSLFDK